MTARLTLALLLLFCPRGHTSGRQEQYTLAQLIAQSTLIVVAERATPADRAETIELRPRKEARLPSGLSKPVVRHLQRWTVREVLRGRRATVGEVLEVRRGNESMWREVQARREFEQVNKIVLIPTYRSPREAELAARPDGGPQGEGRRILFLRWAGDGHELTAEGAVESLAARDEVVKLAQAARRDEPEAEESDETPVPPPRPR